MVSDKAFMLTEIKLNESLRFISACLVYITYERHSAPLLSNKLDLILFVTVQFCLHRFRSLPERETVLEVRPGRGPGARGLPALRRHGLLWLQSLHVSIRHATKTGATPTLKPVFRRLLMPVWTFFSGGGGWNLAAQLPLIWSVYVYVFVCP